MLAEFVSFILDIADFDQQNCLETTKVLKMCLVNVMVMVIVGMIMMISLIVISLSMMMMISLIVTPASTAYLGSQKEALELPPPLKDGLISCNTMMRMMQMLMLMILMMLLLLMMMIMTILMMMTMTIWVAISRRDLR